MTSWLVFIGIIINFQQLQLNQKFLFLVLKVSLFIKKNIYKTIVKSLPSYTQCNEPPKNGIKDVFLVFQVHNFPHKLYCEHIKISSEIRLT